MNFSLPIPTDKEPSFKLTLATGECLFVLGANGTGKSSLMHRFYCQNFDNSRRISAHRQTWFTSNALNLSPEQKRNTESSIQSTDKNPDSRWKEDYPGQRASIAIYDLIEAENVRARLIAAAVDNGDIELAKDHAKKEAPVRIINELLRLSNIPIEISVLKNEQVVASKSGGPRYSIAELSDGERNAILIAANILTVPSSTLVIIDEPERHLHRSIISPLLTLLFQRRSDCAFVVSTHDVMLPMDNTLARTLLLRGCAYENRSVKSWIADLVEPNSTIDENLRQDLLGSRRRIIFVEGDESSLDKPLYSLIFPNTSIIAKGSCREVERAVSGVRSAEGLHWLKAFGIVDNDRRSEDEIEKLKSRGIYAVSVHSVESVYYHPKLQHLLANRHATLTGRDANACLADARNAIIDAIRPHVARLSQRVVEKQIREEFFGHLPKRSEIEAGTSINFSIDVRQLIKRESDSLNAAIENEDLDLILSAYPVRETSALADIARNLGFQDRLQYEDAVRKLLLDEDDALCTVRSLFGTLPTDLNWERVDTTVTVAGCTSG